jgi:hypothetical protein
MNIEKLIKNKVVRNNKLYKIFLSEIQSGPLDGGCYAMAKALKIVLKSGALYSITEKGIAQHVVLSYLNYYIDADGISREQELLSRWKKLERLKNPRLREFCGEDVPESPRNQKLIDKVVAYLLK